MKKLLFGLAAIGLAFTLTAATPTYVTKVGAAQAGGTTNQVIFPADATTQIRLVSLNCTADTNLAKLSFYTCSGAYLVTATNSGENLTIGINATNGLQSNDTIILQRAGVCYIATAGIVFTNTNLVLASSFTVGPVAGDEIYKVSTTTVPTVLVGSNSTGFQLNGEAIFVGNYGRPVLITLAPCHVTNNISSATARYE